MTWFMFWMWVAFSAVSAILQKAPSGFKDSGSWTKPSAEEGKTIPIVLGTCRLRGPNCLWFGDVSSKAIKKKSGGFMGIGAKKVKTGCKYFCGCVLGLSTTIDAVLDIIVGDKSFADAGVSFPWTYSASGTTKTIALDNLFGGKESEGGISGKLSFYFGSDSQTGNAYYAAKRGKSAPGFRGMCYIVLEKMYIGTMKYMKEWHFVVRHCPTPTGMDSAKANIDGDANPAHGTAYLMTTPKSKGGMGISISRLDISSFNTAATTLFNEGLGISLLIDDAQSADTWLATIRQTIDAAIYTDPVTGLWTMKLIRADYTPSNLTEFTDADCVSNPKMTRPSWADTINKVIVRYNSRMNGFTIRTVTDRDPGNRAVQGIDRVQTMDFPAISKLANARIVAARERKQLSYPVAAFELMLKRKAWSLRPGSAFLLTNTILGISKMPCRVLNIKYGALEAGEIKVEATEDIFGISTTAYSGSTPSAWTSPIAVPVPVAFQVLVEAPYGVIGAERNVFAMGARGDTVTENLDVWANEGSGYLESNTCDPTPSGTLQASWSAKTAAKDMTGFIVAGVDLDSLESTNSDGCARGVNLALVGNEWISWTTITDNGDNTFTIAGNLRGIFDTVPEDHAAGERVWFLSEGCSLTQISSTGSGAGSVGADGEDGISIVWTGDYASATSYNLNEACSLDGSSFISLQDNNTGHTPDPSGDTAWWGIMALKGESAATGTTNLVSLCIPDTPPLSPNAWDDEFSSDTGPSGSATWSWGNQGSSTYIIASGALIISAPAGTGDQYRTIQKSVTGSSWSITSRVALHPKVLSDYNQAGILLRNSSTGRLLILTISSSTTNNTCISLYFNYGQSYGGTGILAWTMVSSLSLYLRLTCDGTTIRAYYSVNGEAFTLLGSQALASWISSVDQVGMFANSNNASNAVDAVFSWIRKDWNFAPGKLSLVDNAIDIPPASPNTWNDEFDGNTLNSAWTKTDANNIISVGNCALKFNGFGAIGGNIKKSITRPFKVIAKLVWLTPHAISYEGLYLLFGTTGGACYLFGFQGRHTENQGLSIQNQRYNSNLTLISEILWQRCPTNTLYLSVEDNGTNLIQQVSFNGEDWLTIRSEAYNAWCVVDYFKIEMYGVAGYPFSGRCEWIRRVI